MSSNVNVASQAADIARERARASFASNDLTRYLYTKGELALMGEVREIVAGDATFQR